jgi:hypothetical protein
VKFLFGKYLKKKKKKKEEEEEKAGLSSNTFLSVNLHKIKE